MGVKISEFTKLLSAVWLCGVIYTEGTCGVMYTEGTCGGL